jgi:4-hydroxybutyryl-CoA dehydratase/vinylacetyl-CoA-Delta-isomerase
MVRGAFRILEASMSLLTGKEYVESLKELSPEVYIRGERVQEIWSHLLLRQTVNHVAAGYPR